MINWTEPKPPTQDISPYNHVTCETPLGTIKIEWKYWKQNTDYDIFINNDEWIGVEYSLDSAKELAENYLHLKYRELFTFLYS